MMREWALSNRVMTDTDTRRSLIGSYFGVKKLISTELLKWYIQRGILVTRVYYAMAYIPKRSFAGFAERITNLRRSAAAQGDVTSKRISLIYKLMGNAVYGRYYYYYYYYYYLTFLS